MSLRALQRDFRQWLVAEPARLPATLGEQMRPGLAVHLNNYRSQLLGCLATSYPMLRAWMGESAFDAAAAAFIDASPPRAWSLDAYAEGFPASLTDAAHREFAELELALATAFVGADARPFDANAAAGIDWDSAVLRLLPTVAILPVTTNVADIWRALLDEQPPPPARPVSDGSAILVWRRAYSPALRAVEADEVATLARIRNGDSFGEVCAGLVATLGEQDGTIAAATMLARWLADGLISHIVDNHVAN